MSETKIEQAIKNLDFSIRNLRQSLDRASESSNSFQKRLVFWTKVMAGAIITQIIALIIITFFRN